MKKSLVALLLCLAMLLAMGGMAAAEDPLRAYEGVTINAMLEGHPSSNAIKQLVPEFEEVTGIKVNCEILPYEEMPQKILLGFNQGNDYYDIVMNDRFVTAGYVANDYILALDDYIADSRINQFVDMDDFVPKYIEASKYDGKIYGLPVYGESTFLMYRKDLFEEYGIEVPQTLEELVQAARTVVEKSDGKIAGITMRGQQGIHVLFTWSGFLWGFGGRWLDEEGKLDVASPEAIKAAEVYADLLANYGPQGYANFGWQENRLMFQQGKAAMTIDATVNGAYCEDPNESVIVGKVGYAPVPAGEGVVQQGGQHALAVHEMYISKFSKNPEAAFMFMTWALSAQTQAKCMQIESHCGVSSLGAMQSDVFKEKYGAFTDGMLAAIDQANVDYVPQNQFAQEIINRVGTAMSQVLAGTKSAQDALTEVNQVVNTEVIK